MSIDLTITKKEAQEFMLSLVKDKRLAEQHGFTEANLFVKCGKFNGLQQRTMQMIDIDNVDGETLEFMYVCFGSGWLLQKGLDGEITMFLEEAISEILAQEESLTDYRWISVEQLERINNEKNIIATEEVEAAEEEEEVIVVTEEEVMNNIYNSKNESSEEIELNKIKDIKDFIITAHKFSSKNKLENILKIKEKMLRAAMDKKQKDAQVEYQIFVLNNEILAIKELLSKQTFKVETVKKQSCVTKDTHELNELWNKRDKQNKKSFLILGVLTVVPVIASFIALLLN